MKTTTTADYSKVDSGVISSTKSKKKGRPRKNLLDRTFKQKRVLFPKIKSGVGQENLLSRELDIWEVNNVLNQVIEEVESGSDLAQFSHEDFFDETTEGWYMRHSACHALLTSEKSVELILLAQAGDKVARDKLIISNQRLVVRMATRYIRWLPLMDLIQEGNIGLIRAIQLFNVDLGYKFSTYAVWWMRNKMCRAINRQGHTIVVKNHVHGGLATLRSATIDFADKNGRDPTYDELFKLMPKKIGADAFKRLYFYKDNSVQSLDDVVEHNGVKVSYYDTVPDVRIPEPYFHSMALDELRDLEAQVQLIVQAVNEQVRLSTSHKRVFFMRYGIGGEEFVECMARIGRKNNITRERVRQILTFIWKRLHGSSKHCNQMPSRKEFERRLARLATLEDLSSEKSTIVNCPWGRPLAAWAKHE